MGREIKRVAANFDWPLSKKWDGYINPYSVPECIVCKGTGYSGPAKLFGDEWYGYAPFDPTSTGSKPYEPSHPVIQAKACRNILRDFQTGIEREETAHDAFLIATEAQRLARHFNSCWCYHLSQDDVQALVGGNRLWDLTREWTPDGWKDRQEPYVPTAAEVNEWALGGLGHDSINQWICVEARCKRVGVPSECPSCKGDGHDIRFPEIAKLSEEWGPTEPPAGEWWQVWETVSEGSPVTPAFATAEELIDYLVANGDAWDQKRGHGGWSRENATAFVSAGYAPSLVAVNGSVYTPREAGEIEV